MDEGSRQMIEDCFLRPIPNARVTNEPAHTNPVKAAVKSELQILRLPDDCKTDIMKTLRHVRGQDFQLGQRSQYKEMGTILTKGYWKDRGNLVVHSATDFSNLERTGDEQMDRRRMAALTRLETYGFEVPHILEAFDFCDNNAEQAIELLFRQYFPAILYNQPRPEQELSDAEIAEMRADELDALQSIYEKDVIEERAKNREWVFKLRLDYLLVFSESEQKKQATKAAAEKKLARPAKAAKPKSTDKCKNMVARGKCKYGDKCRYSHDMGAQKSGGADAAHLDLNWFYLEMRFPEGNLYPHETPLLAVKTTNADIPRSVCLRITHRCLREAQQLARDGMPSAYAIADLLQNETEIMDHLKNDRYEFPHPKSSIFTERVEATAANGEQKPLPTHYKRGTTGRSEFATANPRKMLADDVAHSKSLDKRKHNANYKSMLATRQKLPAWSMSAAVLAKIAGAQVVVITGETGSGKSTQIPQFILDDYFERLGSGGGGGGEAAKMGHVQIVCTQPRRLSAIGVAERVANERCERIGAVVGYQVRLENKISPATRLTFCTTGILLRRLQSDPTLATVTHVIIDEVHERSEESDFLLLILKDLLAKRRNLRVILMSATVNAALFAGYFGTAPVVEIPGRTFPVQQIFLEEVLERCGYVLEADSQHCKRLTKGEEKQLVDELEYADVIAANAAPPLKIPDEQLAIAEIYARYAQYSRAICKTLFLMDPMKINAELVESVLRHIVDNDEWPADGSILIFLPGLGEIQLLHDALNDSSVFSERAGRYLILPLHSTLTNEEQSRIFARAPAGKRKIILSTNIAETSVTIDDCVFVIDCGQMKEKHFDTNRSMESLDLVWESRANAQQRRGRAGRVMAGICIHLFTRHRHQYNFIAQPVPEIKRVPLEQLLLRIKTLPIFEASNVHQVIAKILECPSEESVVSAIGRLQDVGALDEHDNLTALGAILATLPVDVRIGKLMLFGAIFQSVDSVLTIAACLGYKTPFVSPFNKRAEAEKRKRSFAVGDSDHLTILRAYQRWLEADKKSRYAGRTFAEENYLSLKTLQTIIEIKHQYLELLVASGFIPSDLTQRRRGYQKSDCIAELSGADMNVNGDNFRLLGSLLCAALYPNIVKVLTPERNFTMTAGGAVPRIPKANELKFKTAGDRFVNIHPSSVNAITGNFASPFLVFQEKVKTSRIFIRDCTMITTLSLVLFSGRNICVQMHGGAFIIIIDNWIAIQAESLEVAEMMKYLREDLLSLLEQKICDPCLNLLHHDNGNRIIRTIIDLVSNDKR